MQIPKDLVEKVAHLAKLKLTDEEKELFTKDMANIIEFAEQINQVDLDNQSATAHVIPIENVFRDDRLQPSMDRDLLLQNAPRQDKGCFSVPKVVD